MSEYKPFINAGPGDIIRDELEFVGWNQKDLAEVMGRSEKSVSELVRNKVAVSYETASQLAAAFKQSPQFWINLDANYRRRLEESAAVKDTAARALIYRYMPVRDLRKVIGLPKKIDGLKDAIKDFWGIKELKFDFLEQQAAAYFRKSKAHDNFEPYYALTWLRLAKISLAGKVPKEKYDTQLLRNLADQIPALSCQADGIKVFISELQSCGVAFLQQNHFEKTYIDGATFMHKGHPVIVYTTRFNRNDNFWFTMAHEIGHILLHSNTGKDFFIDSMDSIDDSDKLEAEADRFAESILKSRQILDLFTGVMRPSKRRICSVAEQLNIAPALVAGILQHHNKAAYSSFSALKLGVRDELRHCG